MWPFKTKNPKRKDYKKNNFKIKKLQGIANNAVKVDYRNPFRMISAPSTINVNLITRKISPKMKKDDVSRSYKMVTKWFHEAIKKEGIPLRLIKKAEIIIEPQKYPRCIIETENRIYYSK